MLLLGPQRVADVEFTRVVVLRMGDVLPIPASARLLFHWTGDEQSGAHQPAVQPNRQAAANPAVVSVSASS